MTPIDRETVVSGLAEEWAALLELGLSLTEQEWSSPSPLPGWNVADNFLHMIGTEEMLAGTDVPDVDIGPTDHLRNAIAETNERWLVALRGRSQDEILTHFRQITETRLVALRAMGDDAFSAPSPTPAGDATYGRFMRIRLFDCWYHEQDVRAAVGRPGHTRGLPAELSADEIEPSLGYVIGKLGGAPEGSRVEITMTGDVVRTFRVEVDDRARVVESFDGPPTVALAAPFAPLMRLFGGRSDAPEPRSVIQVTGDDEVADFLMANLAYMI